MQELDRFTQAYLECAVWASMDADGNPLDDMYDETDLAPDALTQAIKECKEFQEANAELLFDYPRSSEQAGHDYWLSRNGHGTGFWDRGAGAVGNALHEAAKLDGGRDLYVGDDGLLYFAQA